MRNVFAGLALICTAALWTLGAGIYLLTLYFAYLTSFSAVMLTLTFPILGQLYWIWAIWLSTGTFFNILTILCLVWIGLGVVLVISAAKAEN